MHIPAQRTLATITRQRVQAALTTPTLLRLRRRFGTWLAPGIALALFALAFTLSTLVVGPVIRGDDAPANMEEVQPDPHGH